MVQQQADRPVVGDELIDQVPKGGRWVVVETGPDPEGLEQASETVAMRFEIRVQPENGIGV